MMKSVKISQHMDSLVVINFNLCNPKKCKLECKRACFVNQAGKKCIIVDNNSKHPLINEMLCIGCSSCQGACPALLVQQAPKMESQPLYRYAANSFMVYSLPLPSQGVITSLFGRYHMGTQTIFKIIAGIYQLNYGEFQQLKPRDISVFHFSEDFEKYFKRLYNNEVKTVYKPEYVNLVQKHPDHIANTLVKQHQDRDQLVKILGGAWLDLPVKSLVLQQVQRLQLLQALTKPNFEVLLIHDISSGLDIPAQIQLARYLQNLVKQNSSLRVLIADQNVPLLNYLATPANRAKIAGVPHVYCCAESGIESQLGKNANSLRDLSLEQLAQSISEPDIESKVPVFNHPAFVQMIEGHRLDVPESVYLKNQCIALIGDARSGKSSLLSLFARRPNFDPIFGQKGQFLPQVIASFMQHPGVVGANPIVYFQEVGSFNYAVHQLTADEYLCEKIGQFYANAQFRDVVVQPFAPDFLRKRLHELAPKECHMLSLFVCLGKMADVYLLDEPSLLFDRVQRQVLGDVLVAFRKLTGKTMFIVDYDLSVLGRVATHAMRFSGGKVGSIERYQEALNTYLAGIEIKMNENEEFVDIEEGSKMQ